MTRRTARRLPRQPGRSGWEAILPARAPRPRLEGLVTADVAVVGAGFAGLTTARRLAELDPGLKVVVLEAGEVGTGPAGRNSGFMIDLPHDLASDNYSGTSAAHDRSVIAQNRLAIDYARDFAAETQLSPEVFDPSGKINAAATPGGDKHNRHFASYLESLGEPSSLLDARDMAELTGTTFYSSGLHTPGAVMIQPAAYVRALAEALGPAVTLYEQSAVREIAQVGADWCLKTGQGAVTARRVVLATNGHAESFGVHAGRLMHVFTYASMTRALSSDEMARLGGAPRWGVTPADPMGTSVRRYGDRIAVRARFTYDPAMEVSDRRIRRVGQMHDEKFRQRFEMLGDVTMEHRWAGHLCLSRNGVPGFTRVEEGIVAAVCQNGLGTVQGTLSGLAAAEVSVDQPGAAAAAFKGEPLEKLPPEPLASIGANVLLRYKEWRAGAE